MKIIHLQPPEEHLHGMTLAQDHMEKIRGDLLSSTTEPGILLLDFVKAKSVTASYIRGTLLWAILCGQAGIQKNSLENVRNPWDIRPLQLYAAFKNAPSELGSDVNDFFQGVNLPLLEVTKNTEAEVQTAKLRGKLDPLLTQTLQKIVELKGSTAADLFGLGQENISSNGWNNRLADLFQYRLLTRKREGKFWKYSALTREIILWA